MTDRKNGGFTLVELMVVILVGSIITLAATTVLLFSLRIYLQSNEIQKQQNNTRILMTALEDMAAEGTVKSAEKDANGNWNIYGEDDGGNPVVLMAYGDQTISVGGNAVLTGVTVFNVFENPDTDLLTIEIETENGTNFSASIYCRLGITAPAAPTEGSLTAFSAEPAMTAADTPELHIAAQLYGKKDSAARTAFVENLLQQQDSSGTIQGSEEYFSQWYISAKEGGEKWGGSWNSDTPWCACFVSWALSQTPGVTAPADRVNGSGVAYWYANVDEFMEYFDPNNEGSAEGVSWHWNTVLVPHSPTPGDLIFFDWTADTESNPEHMGVVLYTDNGGTAFDTSDDTVYTIEGNTYGTTAIRSYSLTDPQILGYGTLNWTPNA